MNEKTNSRVGVLAGAVAMMALLGAAVLLLLNRPPVPIQINPISVGGDDVDMAIQEIDWILKQLSEQAADLRLQDQDFPEGIDNLYEVDLELIYKRTAEQRFLQDMQIFFGVKTLTDEMLDRKLQEILDGKYQEMPPQEVVETEWLRLLAKERAVELAKLIWRAKELIDIIKKAGLNAEFEEENLQDFIDQIVEDWSILFGDSIEMIELIKMLLDGVITEQQFRDLFDLRIPPITWNWL